MATEAARASLLDRRLVIVTGKGGTGKTTVTAALAFAAAERGRRVLAIEVGPFAHLPGLLGEAPALPPAPKAAVDRGQPVRPGLNVLRIDPFAALAEYFGAQIGSGMLVERILRNRGLQQLLAGAPGWRELVMLGKTWHLEQLRGPDGRPVFDLVVVDAPATGHGLTFLDVPHVVRSAVRGGPLARNALRVEALMLDPSRTLVLPVSLAEELPAQETAELAERVRDDLGMPIDRIIVNAVARPVPGDDAPGLLARLEALPPTLGLRGLPEPPSLAHAVAHLDARHRLNAHYVAEIARRTGLPTVCLPLLERGVTDDEALRTLGLSLLETPERSERHCGPGAPARTGSTA